MVDDLRQRLARVQLLVVQPVQGGAVVGEAAGVQAFQGGAAQQFDAVAELTRAAGAESFKHGLLGLGAGEDQRALLLQRQACGLAQLGPQAVGLARQVEHRSRRLAGDQGLAEVADGGAERRGGALEDLDLEAALGAGPGMGEAEHAGTDDQQVAVVLTHEGTPRTERRSQRDRMNQLAAAVGRALLAGLAGADST
ncbi:hypothetical protein D9M70_505350 [compost metagenome]